MPDYLYVIVGGLLMADTLLVKLVSNWNMGVVMPFLLGLPIFCYGIFRSPLDELFASGLGHAVRFVFILGYCLFFVLFVVCVIIIKYSAHGSIPKKIDAVIVLGAGLKGEKPSLLLRNRLDTALKIAEKTKAVIVVSGGQGKNEEIPEAEAMVRYLVMKRFPCSRILKEDKSVSTYENFLFSRKILETVFPNGFTTVFVTSDFHLFRARIAARYAGFEMRGIPAPSAWYMFLNFYLRETLAITRYFMIGVI